MNRQIVIKGFVAALVFAVVVQLAGACSSRAASAAATRSDVQTNTAGAQAWRDAERFSLAWGLAAGRVIEIKGVNGGIDAAPSSSGEVEVVARRARGAATRTRCASKSSSTPMA